MEKEKFEWSDLKSLGKSDNANRWYPTDQIAKEYCNHYRSPSRKWPFSYAKACLTKKFHKYYKSKILLASE